MSGPKLDQTWSKSKFVRFVRQRFPTSGELHLAALTGIPAPTCKKHLYGETKPSADHLLAYLATFGPELLVAMMGVNAPQWVKRGQGHEQIRQLKITQAQLAKRLTQYQMGKN